MMFIIGFLLIVLCGLVVWFIYDLIDNDLSI